ncbi:MAG TPA: hypothetical protein VGO13_05000 [Solirubrobacterales bacterium]|jgi:predicted lactoylglutathione lyase|nr:hypothetical protein [Solirubrobacterales bacterium]
MKQRVSLITLRVADLERARSFYEALDWTTGAEPGYSGVFVDPDGHPWEVAHNPHWRIAEDGRVRLN